MVREWLRQLCEFVRIPSVSGSEPPTCAAERGLLANCARLVWRVRLLATTTSYRTAERLGNPGKPTVLIYGHCPTGRAAEGLPRLAGRSS